MPKPRRDEVQMPPMPLAPLELRACLRYDKARPVGFRTGRDHERLHATTSDLAALFGVTHRTYMRWRSADAIPFWSADRAAVAMGCHPAEIWPDFYAEAA